ncbi:MAG: serine/threonine-protein kinase PknK [Myxococcales bacterium]|nr:serine/threonine-protein kinase PknK [Myxococcales bacterium]
MALCKLGACLLGAPFVDELHRVAKERGSRGGVLGGGGIGSGLPIGLCKRGRREEAHGHERPCAHESQQEGRRAAASQRLHRPRPFRPAHKPIPKPAIPLLPRRPTRRSTRDYLRKQPRQTSSQLPSSQLRLSVKEPHASSVVGAGAACERERLRAKMARRTAAAACSLRSGIVPVGARFLADPKAAEVRFAVVARAGGGASGEIFKAIDNASGQTVALKLLRASCNEEERTRFRREIEVLADLRHPNIVDYVAHGVWPDGRPYVAMEWLDGEDLSQRSRRLPLGMRDAVEVVRRAAQALAAIHARGLVHRDLKLQNIYLVKGRGTSVKLIDFGVVKPAAFDGFATSPGMILGTPHYMSPEQARGESVDARADVYSLGSVLFRLLTGRTVFESEHVIALLGRLVLEDAPRPGSVRFDIPTTLDEVLSCAISRNRDERYPHAGELARALARVGQLGNEPPDAERSRSQVRREPGRAVDETTKTGSSGGTGNRPTRPGLSFRRVVACLLYDLNVQSGERTISADIAHVTGDDVRIERIAGGQAAAVFGVERSRGDEIIRAVRTAIQILADFPNARIAVAKGHAVLARSNLAGESLDRAAAQLELAEPGMIRLDLHASAALETIFELVRDAHGARVVREDPRELGPRELLGTVTPTLGRERELATLLNIYDETTRDSLPRAALVLGAPGIGKSRLKSELTQRLALAQIPPEVLACRGKGPMRCALGDAFRERIGLQDGTALDEQIALVEQYFMARMPRNLHFLAPFLGEFTGVAFPDEHDEALRAARGNVLIMQSRVRMALEAYVRTQSGRLPQVLLLDDVEAADDATLELIGWLQGCTDVRLVVFGFALPELETTRAGLWTNTQRQNESTPPPAGSRMTRLLLPPLSTPAAERIIATVLPSLDGTRRQEIIRRAAGNPFVLEELVRTAAEGRRDIPLTVQELVQRRLDHLPPDLQETVRAATVFGHVFWTAGVESLLGRSVDDDLAAAEREELIHRESTSRIVGQAEWTFRQAMVRDAAHTSLLDEDRRTLHTAAAAWHESVGSTDYGLMAYHCHLGGERAKAASLYARATHVAIASAGHMDAALELAGRGLACGAAGVERARLLVTQALVHSRRARLPEAIAAADEASALAPVSSDTWVEAQWLAAGSLIVAGAAADAEARLAWALSEQVGATLLPQQRALLLSARARALVELCQPALALSTSERAVESAQQAGHAGTTALLRALDSRQFAQMNAGATADAIATGHQLMSLADSAGDVHLASRARINTGSTLNYLGMYETAEALFIRATADAKSYRLRLIEAMAHHNLGSSLARLGDLDRGLELQEEAIRIGDECGAVRVTVNARMYACMMLCWRAGPGDLWRADALATAISDTTAQHPGLQILPLFARALVDLRRGLFASALHAATLAQVRLLEDPTEEMEEAIRLCHIEVLLALGRDAEADDALRVAFRSLEQRVATIRGAEFATAFTTRNHEAARLLHYAFTRLGLRLLPSTPQPGAALS